MTTVETNQLFPLSHVHSGARIRGNVHIGPFSSIAQDVEIGEGSWVGPNVVLMDGVRIGKNCRIMPNTVISADYKQIEFWRKDAPKTNGRHPLVEIGDNVHIESSTMIHGEITIAADCWIGSNVSIHDGARIGQNVKIFPGAVIAAIPQDLKFHGERTTLEIGENTSIRECATLNRGTDYHGRTVVGKNVLIMAYVHVAHDCIVGDNVVISNAVNMAGHVEIGEYAIIGGMTAVHQFVKVGKHAFVSGGSLVGKDVPPFVKAGRSPLQYAGINSTGLRRRSFSNEAIHNLQEIYRCIFLNGMNTSVALDYIEAHLPPTEERDEVLMFVRNASRGIIKGHGGKELEP